MKKIEIKVDDEFTVDFTKNLNGGSPVGRIEGMVAFIDKAVRSFVVPNSTWIVRVVSVHDTFLTIEPLIRIRTVKDNEILIAAKVAALIPPKKERTKTKKGYQYKTFAELQMLKNLS